MWTLKYQHLANMHLKLHRSHTYTDGSSWVLTHPITWLMRRIGVFSVMTCLTVVMEGGSITSWRTADYLFSEDANCPDTLRWEWWLWESTHLANYMSFKKQTNQWSEFCFFCRIFESRDYLWNKVVVFHSMFLSTCEKRQSVTSVCIGHYVLPPVSVQDGD